MRKKFKAKTYQTPSGVFSLIYPITPKVGTTGKYHPSRKPNDRVVNAFHVSEQARTFGIRARI